MFFTRRRILAGATMLAATLGFGAQACAQAPYPNKPIMIVVPYPPGGDSDAIARTLAEKLAERVKQPVLVENKPGASGAIGSSYVAHAAPDGYTILFTPNPFTLAPLVMKLSPGVNYDPVNGFDPVIFLVDQPDLLVANPNAGAKTLPELIERARSGKPVTFGSSGAGSPLHIAGEWLNRAAGVKMTHVPYRGTAPAITDAVAGHLDTTWTTIGAVRQYMEAGKLIPLAVDTAQRTKLLPNVPTLVELGYKDVVVGSWSAIYAPKGTPADVVKTLNQHFNDILKMPDVAEKLMTFGAVPVGGTPERLAEINAKNYATMGKVIQELGISAE